MSFPICNEKCKNTVAGLTLSPYAFFAGKKIKYFKVLFSCVEVLQPELLNFQILSPRGKISFYKASNLNHFQPLFRLFCLRPVIKTIIHFQNPFSLGCQSPITGNFANIVITIVNFRPLSAQKYCHQGAFRLKILIIDVFRTLVAWVLVPEALILE